LCLLIPSFSAIIIRVVSRSAASTIRLVRPNRDRHSPAFSAPISRPAPVTSYVGKAARFPWRNSVVSRSPAESQAPNPARPFCGPQFHNTEANSSSRDVILSIMTGIATQDLHFLRF
jgi:hypothetical protein